VNVQFVTFGAPWWSIRSASLRSHSPDRCLEIMINSLLWGDPPAGLSSRITKAGISGAASHTRHFHSQVERMRRLVGENAPESFE
jgi:hypothetical protein